MKKQISLKGYDHGAGAVVMLRCQIILFFKSELSISLKGNLKANLGYERSCNEKD